jgi:hypothetical protein
MIEHLNAPINVDKDERWERVLVRFTAIETQLQELYWEVVEYTQLDCGDL